MMSKKRDEHGRLLAYVFDPNIYDDEGSPYPSSNPIYYWEVSGILFFNATIIKAGYAAPLAISPNVKYVPLFKELYKEAREEKRGSWAGENNAGAEKVAEITENMLNMCEQDDDCIIVDHSHCCGATKKAINKIYLKEYNEHPEWQKFFNENSCALIGMCPDDSFVTQASCQQTDGNLKRCQMLYEEPREGGAKL